MTSLRESWLTRPAALFEITAPDAERARRRIVLMERNMMLPAKLFIILLTWYSFSRSPWTGAQGQSDVVVEMVEKIFWIYVLVNLLLAGPLLAVRRLPLAGGQWLAFASSVLDALFLAAMTVVTGGVESILFWLFIGLILRNAVSVPPGVSQLILNFTISICYALAVLLDASVLSDEEDPTKQIFNLTLHEHWGEPLLLRMVVLGLMTLCCSGLELLLQKQRLAIEEAAALAAAENQLHSAGRIAAEFAHQIKNPLAVINNAAHSLQRSLREKRTPAIEHVEIIQEEVERVDAVVTRIMGYAQLQEQTVERLDVVKLIESAIAAVFPPALPTGIKVKKNYAGNFPPLLMQRGHLLEMLLNLLKNAREALGDKGTVTVTADHARDHTVEISVADDGPGIPDERRAQIFEAFYTTKKTGTGLGLAVVKHNAELYGGSVRVDSKLGKGAKFTVVFPPKPPAPSLMS
jgi:signal transduction histidine kinase